jgi:tripartite-type tricarboxylate transporter receptor subunit TctC
MSLDQVAGLPPTSAASRPLVVNFMRSIHLAPIVALLAAGTVPAAAQSDYPDRNIRLIYGFSPGSDVATRMLADKLGEVFGRSVVVDNVTGAGGNIAADRTAKAAPDGYTLGNLGNANIVINGNLYSKLSFDPMKDLVPITQVFRVPLMLVVNNGVPAKSVAELVTLARARPGTMTFGHSGLGTVAHLSIEIFKSMARIDIQDVPYRGPPQTITDLSTGRITASFMPATSVRALIQDGKLRALAVTTRERIAVALDLPTMIESGFPGFETTIWFGLFAPKGTPRPVIDRLSREAAQIMKQPEVRKKLNDMGYVVLGNTPAEFADVIKAETPYWARVIKDAGIKPIE